MNTFHGRVYRIRPAAAGFFQGSVIEIQSVMEIAADVPGISFSIRNGKEEQGTLLSLYELAAFIDELKRIYELERQPPEPTK